MKLGRYIGNGETYHQRYGLLKPGEIYELDDDWDFERETLFEQVMDMPVQEALKDHRDKSLKRK